MKSVEVIIVENIPTLGQIGDVVKVAPGYARNYLIPKGLAILATKKNLKAFEEQRKMLLKKRELFKQHLAGVAEKLNEVVIALKRKVAEDTKLYGSVSAMDIVEALHEMGFPEIHRKNVVLDQPIKNLGEYEIPIKIDADIKAKVKVVVEKE